MISHIKPATIILLSLGLFFLSAIPALAEEVEEPPLPPSMSGRVEETGTLFEITDSEYLNISLESTEEIKVVLESVPKTISLNIEASSVSVSTVLTFSNLEPNTTYYKFEDSYKNKTILTTNNNGSYTFTQDLTQHHHIWFQLENDGTVYLPVDCTDYGTWDELTSTCTLTQDIFESVEIVEDNIVLDCNNHEITTFYYGYGYGIYLSGRTGLTIKNCTVTNFYTGTYLAYSSDNTIIDNSLSGNYYPIWVRSSYPQFSGNQIQNNGLDGIILSDMELNRDYTLTGAPVFINYDHSYDSIIVPEGYTLTIEPGTILKSVYSTSGLKIDGTLIAEGTENEPIVFTTLYDDDYGDDTNNDGEETQGSAGFWGQIVFTSTSINSSLNHIIVRYGGRRWIGAPYYSVEDYVLKISGSDLTLVNSVIENNTLGFHMENSGSQVTKTTFKDHQYDRPFWSPVSTGLSLVSSNPQIRESTFQNNRRGIYTQGGQPIIEDNVFSGNSRPIWVNNSYPQFARNQIEDNGLDGVVLKGMILNQDYTLGGGPVFINYESFPSWGIIVPEGRTLTIEPGTIIKFVGTSVLTIEGTLIAEGTTEEPIVFTTLKDDEYGGDTNGDGDATHGSAGEWGQIVFTPISMNSSLDHVVIRYGGKKWATAPYHWKEDYVLKITDSDLTLSNSIIENNVFGFYMENSNSPITRTTFQDHQYTKPFWWHYSTGLKLVSSNPAIGYSVFSNNKQGIDVISGSATIRNSSFYDNNRYGIINNGPDTVDAIQNWWGDSSGPYHPSLNPDGQGDRISDRVDFIPWLGYDPTVNQPPSFSNLDQYKSDEATFILEGGITTESTVVFKATVSDPDNDKVKLQVQIKEVDHEWQDIIESDLVNSGSEAIITREELFEGQYMWRARAKDENGAVSGDWQEFGTPGNVDFEVRLVPLYTQVRSPYPSDEETFIWSLLKYADGNAKCGFNIGRCGCAITSEVMILRFYDIETAVDETDINPLAFNDWLTNNKGYKVNGDVKWEKIDEYSKDSQTGLARLQYVGPKNFKDITTLDFYLGIFRPVILKTIVQLPEGSSPHFIVADGKLTNTYTIRDPAWYNTRYLTQAPSSYAYNYNNNFYGLRLFSPIIIPRKGIISMYLASPAELLVTDPLGRKLGKDPIANIEYNEIPDSFYYSEAIGNPFISTPVQESKNIWIPDPIDGEYDVKVIGIETGSYTMGLSAYDEIGQSKDVTQEGNTTTDNIQKFDLSYSTETVEEVELHRIVDIDIKPGSDPNSINLKSKGVTPVAVLTDEFFDAKDVVIDSVIFAEASPKKGNLKDVDNDDDLDLMLRFETQDLQLTLNDIEATLTGQLTDGTLIKGTDSVKVISPGKSGKQSYLLGVILLCIVGIGLLIRKKKLRFPRNIIEGIKRIKTKK